MEPKQQQKEKLMEELFLHASFHVIRSLLKRLPHHLEAETPQGFGMVTRLQEDFKAITPYLMYKTEEILSEMWKIAVVLEPQRFATLSLMDFLDFGFPVSRLCWDPEFHEILLDTLFGIYIDGEAGCDDNLPTSSVPEREEDWRKPFSQD